MEYTFDEKLDRWIAYGYIDVNLFNCWVTNDEKELLERAESLLSDLENRL